MAKYRSQTVRANRIGKTSWFDYFNVIFMALFCTTILYPFLNMFARSFSTDAAIMLGKVFVWPVNFNTYGYRMVVVSSSFYTALKNTLFIAVAGSALNLSITLSAGYVFARGVPGKKVLFLLVLFTMFFNGGMIPTYLIIRKLNLYDTYGAYIFPAAFGAFNMILARNFFQNLPREVFESAQIDGCNDLRMFIRIALPMSKPVVATLSLFVIVGFWNMFMPGILYTISNHMSTLQMYIRRVVFLSQMGLDTGATLASHYESQDASNLYNQEPIKAVVLVLGTVPVLCVYPFLQKYFVHGINMGAVKG